MKQNHEDRVLSEFLRALGPWRDIIVIGGGFALFIYKLYLADPTLKIMPVGTRDIDSLVPRRPAQIADKDIANSLKDAGFTPLFKDVEIPATESYTKEIDGTEVEVEFLTDDATRHDKSKNVVIAGVVAQPLSYLTLSLQLTVKFQTYSGYSGNVVAPAVWLFHKGLTFTKRKGPSKILKDLYGIWFLASQLGGLSNQTVVEFHNLSQQHPKWFDTFKKNLVGWIEDATPADWSKLETQDPSGSLKKLGFQRIVKELVSVT